MTTLRIIIILILFISTSEAKKLERVSIQLDWLHQFQFAGYYIAKEKGFYKDFNLDVNIKEFDFGINLLDDVIKSRSEYAIGKSSLITDKLDGNEIVLLTAIYQKSPMVLLSLKKSNINSPKDLKDKKVMLTPDARSAASINSMIISQGLKLKDIKFQEHSFNLEDLISGKTDAMGSYLSNEPFHLNKRGIKFTIHNPSDYGFDFYGGILFTSNEELKNNPLRVRKIYKATLKGWEYAFNNIEETAKLIFEKYNTQNKTLESLIYEGEILKKLSNFEEGLLGKIDYKRIEEIKRLYLLLGVGTKKTNFKFENFIYNPNKISYSSDEKNYLAQNKITLLSNNNFAPFTMQVNDKLKGIEIDYWNLINKKLKIIDSNIEIHKHVRSKISKIENNQNYVKFAFSKRDITENTSLTDPITNIPIGIATLYDKAYLANYSELNNKKIAISKYSSIYPILRKKYPKINFQKVKNIHEALDLLKRKKIYGVIGKVPVLSYNITRNNLTEIKIAGTFKEHFEVKLLVNSKNKTLLKLLNEAISTISEEEKNQIKTKYYSVIYQVPPDYSWFYKIIIPLLLIIIFVVISNRKLNKEISKRKEIEKELHKVANIDSLTGIYNRRKIESLFNSELKRVKRYNRDISVIFFDIDNFKLINDELGHSVGDEVLTKLSSIVKNNIRSIDYFGRWGGEEFIIILPETNKEKAAALAHILKEKIATNDFVIGRNVTCSFGVSQFEETDSEDTLLTRADDAMYYIKRNGKNDVKVV